MIGETAHMEKLMSFIEDLFYFRFYDPDYLGRYAANLKDGVTRILSQKIN